MRWLINYIRSCFCEHEWETLLDGCKVWGSCKTYPDYHKWVYCCKKCKLKKVIKS